MPITLFLVQAFKKKNHRRKKRRIIAIAPFIDHECFSILISERIKHPSEKNIPMKIEAKEIIIPVDSFPRITVFSILLSVTFTFSPRTKDLDFIPIQP